jgi:hypothetical protein
VVLQSLLSLLSPLSPLLPLLQGCGLMASAPLPTSPASSFSRAALLAQTVACTRWRGGAHVIQWSIVA